MDLFFLGVSGKEGGTDGEDPGRVRGGEGHHRKEENHQNVGPLAAHTRVFFFFATLLALLGT